MRKSLDGLLAKGKRALAYTAIALTGFMPMKAVAQDAEWYLNPFNRPRETTIYYGSGYVDSDGDIDSEDVQAIRDGTNNYMADVDGDGDVDEEDALILEDHVANGTILPSEWGSKQTKEGRDSWLKKMALICPNSETLPNDTGDMDTRFVCSNYATQNCINRVGYWESDLPAKYDTTMNGEFDIPTYLVQIITPPEKMHVINATLTGNNFDFKSINFEEPQNDSTNVQPGTWNIPYNSSVWIYSPIEFDTTAREPDMIFGPRIAIFNVDESGNVSLNEASVHPDLVLTRIPQIVTYDITNPIFSPNGDGIKDTSTIHLGFSESVDYDIEILDGGGIVVESWDGTAENPYPKPWDGYNIYNKVFPDGVYNIRVSLEDPAGNTFTDSSKTITLDTTPPVVEITHPKLDSTYTSHVTGLEYLVSDANPDSMWYSSDSGLTKTYLPWESEITGLKSEQGENDWILYAKDKAGNASSDTVRFNVDTTSVAIAEDPAVPSEYSLNQNYPNPFNPSTTISYSIPEGGHVSLSVYDMKGRELETLVNQEQPLGSYQVPFDASEYASGVYFYNLQIEDFNKTRKMLLVK